MRKLLNERAFGFGLLEHIGLDSYSKTLILRVGVGMREAGIILDMSFDLCSLLGYDVGSLIGKSLTHLLPPIIANYHHQFIHSYFGGRKTKILYIDQTLYFKQKNGYLVTTIS